MPTLSAACATSPTRRTLLRQPSMAVCARSRPNTLSACLCSECLSRQPQLVVCSYFSYFCSSFSLLFPSLPQPTRSASRRRTRKQAQRPPSTTVGSSAPPALLVRTPCLCAPCQHCCVNVRMCELIYSPCLSEPHSALGHGCCWCYHGRRARRERGAPGCGDLVRVGGEPGAARESGRRHVHHRAAPQAWPDQDQHTVRHGAQHPLRDRHRSPVPLLLHGCASSTRTAC